MIVAEGRCFCDKHESQLRDTCRMIGTCSNCGTTDILMMFTVGDEKRALACPVCTVWGAVEPVREAQDDEKLEEELYYDLASSEGLLDFDEEIDPRLLT